MIKLASLRHAYPEKQGFTMERPIGHEQYTFLHFFCSMEIEYNGEIIKTEPDAVIIYNIGTPQYFKALEPLLHNWMHFSGDITSLFSKYGLQLDTIYYPENPAFITELLYELEFEHYGSHSDNQRLIDLKFEELLIKLSRSLNKQGVPTLSYETKTTFQNLRHRILGNLKKRWTTKEMAESIGFSESHFYRTYKSLYGVSPTNDIINARIESAENMLFYQNKSVSEIAEALGYENTTHFIRQFKAKTKSSPTEYKKRHKTERLPTE